MDLPTLEIRGLDSDWKYCAYDKYTEDVTVFRSRPELEKASGSWLSSYGSYANVYHSIMDRAPFDQIKSLPWDQSLHKIKHIYS